MRSEREKMMSGDWYRSWDPEIMALQQQARQLCREYNDCPENQPETRRALLGKLLGEAGELVWINSPFQCDYGVNIKVGNRVFFNFNCVVLDCGEVRIGNDVFIGPAVQIYTVIHPLAPESRWSGVGVRAEPVVIGDDVWIGGGAIICPGVKIGSHSVIGAGSVVTKDIPAGVLAVGNPCRVIRSLDKEERPPEHDSPLDPPPAFRRLQD